MSKKIVIYIVIAFMAVLFLSTIGTLYTGYATLKQSELTLKHFPYPFVKYNNYNNLYLVVSDDATLDELEIASGIAQSIKGTIPLPPKIVTESNLPEGLHNLILIGDPCTNKLISKELGISKCNLGLNTNEGILLLNNHDKISILVVSGYNINGIAKASKVLQNYNTFPLKDNKIIINGNVNNIFSLNLKYS